MSYFNKKNKKRKGVFSVLVLLLLLLLLLLLFLDGRFGLGDGRSLQPLSSTPEAQRPEEVVVLQSTLLISENNIIYENRSILLENLKEIISATPEDHMFILVDDKANNSLFESVEKLLKEADRMYTIE